MSRRLLPLLLAFGLGATALGAGLWALYRTFTEERAAALAATEGRRVALEQYARAALAQSLGRQTRTAGGRIVEALEDPLRPAHDLLAWVDGRQRLPRHTAPRAGEDTPASALYRRLADPAHPPPTPDGPWGDRLRMRRALFDALDRGDVGAVEHHVRAILAATTRFVLPAEREIPFLLAVIHRFQAAGRPDPRLMRLLLHAGVPDGHGGMVESLQRRLLRRRDVFTAGDFAFLAERIRALGAPAGVPDVEFAARVAEVGVAVPAEVGEPTLLAGGWYAQPAADGARGVRVREAALLQGLTGEMRGRGLLGPRDRVATRGALLGPVVDAPLIIESPDWALAGAAAEQAFEQKALLLWLCAALAAGILALAVLGQRRKQRYLALKDDFVSTVSHELRTPLASIRLMAETLERRLADVPRARDYPTRIVGAVDGLSLLVENILSFSRLDKGRWVARPEATRLDAVLQAAHDKVVPHAGKPVTWRVVGDASVILHADPELLELLLVNLSRNAVQYCDRAVVELTFTVERGAGVRLSVADNGRGMAPDVARAVFTAFFRAPSSRGSRGSGLGLAICRRIMRLHGGRIRVSSTGPQGTVFALDFPPEILA